MNLKTKIPTPTHQKWKAIQEGFAGIGLFGAWRKLVLTSHDIDTATVALAGYTYLKRKTELIEGPEEGVTAILEPRDWRTLKLE